VRRISKALFGNGYALEIAAAIASWQSPTVHARELARELAVPDNLVHPVLRRLVEAGILVRLPRPRGQQYQEFERMPSLYWELCRQLFEEVSASAWNRAQ